MTTNKMGFTFSKKIIYALLALASIVGFLVIRRVVLIILAPVGFIIYLIESFDKIKQLTYWRSLSNNEKFRGILALTTIIVLAALAAIICWALISSKL